VAIEPLTPERRRERTRRHLIDAAGVVFGQRGYHGASLDEVAALAGFTKGAVYSNFKSKEDLFVAVLEQQVQAQLAQVEALLADHRRPAEVDYAVMRELLTPQYEINWTVLYLEFVLYSLRNPAAQAKVAAYRRRTRDAVERMVEQTWATQDFEPELSARAVATITLALFGGIDLDRLVDPDDLPTSITEDALTFIIAAARGLGEDV
jgi:AcrR family transcriptional regulator